MRRWESIVWVGGLAALAGLVRHGFGQLWPGDFPLLIFNWLGVFILVFVVRGYLARRLSEERVRAISIGFMGGLTTIASPLLSILLQWEKGRFLEGLGLLLLYIFGGLGVALLAQGLAARVWRST